MILVIILQILLTSLSLPLLIFQHRIACNRAKQISSLMVTFEKGSATRFIIICVRISVVQVAIVAALLSQDKAGASVIIITAFAETAALEAGGLVVNVMVMLGFSPTLVVESVVFNRRIKERILASKGLNRSSIRFV